MTRPRIAVLMDENTSSGGTRYEAHKGYFHRLSEAGAAPFGVAYDADLVEEVIASFHGLLTAGGRFAYPAHWYLAPPDQGIETARLDVETALVLGSLAAGKPVLGICAGMQTLACLHGAKLTTDAPGHDHGAPHAVTVEVGTRLGDLVGPELTVNSCHREAIDRLAAGVVATATAVDGVIEAIEIPAYPFAVGLQWHQELLGADHPGQAIFEGLARASSEVRR
jgi:putative glutamine amidotransferase